MVGFVNNTPTFPNINQNTPTQPMPTRFTSLNGGGFVNAITPLDIVAQGYANDAAASAAYANSVVNGFNASANTTLTLIETASATLPAVVLANNIIQAALITVENQTNSVTQTYNLVNQANSGATAAYLATKVLVQQVTNVSNAIQLSNTAVYQAIANALAIANNLATSINSAIQAASTSGANASLAANSASAAANTLTSVQTVNTIVWTAIAGLAGYTSQATASATDSDYSAGQSYTYSQIANGALANTLVAEIGAQIANTAAWTAEGLVASNTAITLSAAAQVLSNAATVSTLTNSVLTANASSWLAEQLAASNAAIATAAALLTANASTYAAEAQIANTAAWIAEGLTAANASTATAAASQSVIANTMAWEAAAITLAGPFVRYDTPSQGLSASAKSNAITNMIGYTPYNATNPSGYISGNQTITVSGDASGSGTTSIGLTLATTGVAAGAYNNLTVDSKGRITAARALNSSDITGALGFTPYNATNPSGYISGITSANVTNALGYTPANLAGATFSGAVAFGSTTTHSGAATFNGGLTSSTAITSSINFISQSTNGYANFAATNGSGYAGWYLDSANFYLLKNPSSETTYDTTRPLICNLSTGNITLGTPVQMSSTLNVSGETTLAAMTATTGLFTGAATFNGGLTSSTAITSSLNFISQSTNGYANFAAVNGSGYAGWYNDGANFYLLKNASSTTSFDTSRPFYVSMSSGDVTMSTPVQMTSTLNVGGATTLAGMTAIGATFSGQVTFQNSLYCYGNQTTHMATATGGLGGIGVTSANNSSAAFMYFNVAGDYAAYFGIDPVDNQFRVGGWSMGANSYPILHSGNYASYVTSLSSLTVSGNINCEGGTVYVSGGSCYVYWDGTYLNTPNNFYASGNGNFNDVYVRSDARIKTNIKPANDVGEIIDQLSIKTFNKNGATRTQYGVLAQEVEAILPESVITTPKPINKNENQDDSTPDDLKSIDTNDLLFIALKEIQSLRSRIAELETR